MVAQGTAAWVLGVLAADRRPRGFVNWRAQHGRWLSYLVGMTLTTDIHQAADTVSPSARTPALDADGQVHDGAWAAGDSPRPGSGRRRGTSAAGWPSGPRLIDCVRRDVGTCTEIPPAPDGTCLRTGQASLIFDMPASRSGCLRCGETSLRSGKARTPDLRPVTGPGTLVSSWMAVEEIGSDHVGPALRRARHAAGA